MMAGWLGIVQTIHTFNISNVPHRPPSCTPVLLWSGVVDTTTVMDTSTQLKCLMGSSG